MSHIATVEVRIVCLDALAIAAEACGLELVRGQTTYRWFGNVEAAGREYSDPARPDAGKCEHALRVKGDRNAYEIGVVRAAGGDGYQLAWDAYGGGKGLMALVASEANRQGVGKLVQRYSLERARRELMGKGCRVVEKAVGNKIRLEAFV